MGLKVGETRLRSWRNSDVQEACGEHEVNWNLRWEPWHRDESLIRKISSDLEAKMSHFVLTTSHLENRYAASRPLCNEPRQF